MTPEHASASKSDSLDFSYPDFLADDRHADLDLLRFSNLDLPFDFWDTSLFQKILEPPLPSPSPTGEFHLTFSSGTLLDTLLLQENDLSCLPDVPGSSGFQPRTTAIPLENDLRERGASRKEVTGTGLQVTGGADPSVAVPTIPPPTPLLSLAVTFPLNWIKVPQRNYNQGRKQWSFKRLEPVSFGGGGRPGINMRDALRKTFDGLDGRDDPVLQDTTGAISCRFLFPGYPANSGSCQIHALDWTRQRLPITRSKLAYEVARKLERYLHYMAKFTLDKSIEDRWTIGQGFMHIDNMFLVRLVSVSKGSFQPEIWVVDPSIPDAALNRE